MVESLIYSLVWFIGVGHQFYQFVFTYIVTSELICTTWDNTDDNKAILKKQEFK
jgi:hypothetical protein